VTDEAKQEPPKPGQREVLRDLQAVLKSMTAKNWKTKKADALAMLTTN
jgi:hypothetical protein